MSCRIAVTSGQPPGRVVLVDCLLVGYVASSFRLIDVIKPSRHGGVDIRAKVYRLHPSA